MKCERPDHEQNWMKNVSKFASKRKHSDEAPKSWIINFGLENMHLCCEWVNVNICFEINWFSTITMLQSMCHLVLKWFSADILTSSIPLRRTMLSVQIEFERTNKKMGNVKHTGDKTVIDCGNLFKMWLFFKRKNKHVTSPLPIGQASDTNININTILWKIQCGESNNRKWKKSNVNVVFGCWKRNLNWNWVKIWIEVCKREIRER